MKNLAMILLFSAFGACGDKEYIPCPGRQPVWKTCVDGVYRCDPNTVEVPGADASLGCVPKGVYDFICESPCPPYSKILLRSNGLAIGQSITGANTLRVQVLKDDHPSEKDWGASEDEQFFAKPLTEKGGYHLEMLYPTLYRVWDGTKEAFSKNFVEGRINATQDSIFLTYHYGWDATQNYRENRCDLVFVKTDYFK